MPDVKIRHPEKGERTVGADQADLLRQALDKGWKLDSSITITHPEKGQRVVDVGQDDLVRQAFGKGWRIDASTPAPAAPTEDTTVGLPDMPGLSADGPVTLESVDQRAYQQSEAAVRDQKFRRDIERQKRDEAIEREFGVGYEAIKADPLNAAENLVQTLGEGAARFYSFGFDAPLAATKATIEQIGAGAQDQFARSAVEGEPDPQLTIHRGVTPGGEQPGITWADRFDAEMGDIQARREVNPVTAFTGEAAGALATGLAAGPAAGAAPQSTVLMRLAAAAPTTRMAQAAARMGVRVAAPLAAQGAAPGLAGSLARIGAPALALGVEGAVQGAPQSAGMAVNDLWQNGTDDSAWEYLSAAGEGLWTGGLLGFGLGAGIGTVKAVKAARAGKGPVSLREAGLAAEAAPDLPPPTMADDAALAAPYPKPEGPGATTAAARKVVDLTPDAAKKLRDGLFPELQAEADEFERVLQDLDENLDLSAKRAFVQKHATTPLGSPRGGVSPKNWQDPATVDQSLRDITSLPSYEALEELAASPAIMYDGKGSAAVLKRLREQLQGVTDELAQTARERVVTEGDLFIALDQQKRYLQKAVSRFSDTGQDLLFEQLDPIAEQMREVLESDLWPKPIADMQRITNKSWSTGIAARQDSALRGMRGERGVKSAAKKYALEPYVEGRWLYNHASNVGVMPPEAQTEAALNRYLNAQAEDALTRAGQYGDDKVVAAAKRADELRKSLRLKLGQVSEWNKSISTSPAMTLGFLEQVPGAGYVAELAADRAREAAYKQTVKTVEQVDKASKLKGLIQGAKPSKGVSVGVATLPTPIRAAASGEVAAYIEKLVAGDPRRDDVVAQLQEALSPGLGPAAMKQIEKQRAFLLAKMGDPKDPQSEQRAMEYGAAMMRPLDALDRIGAGVGTKADRETVQELYPALWERFVRGSMKTLAEPGVTFDDRIRASRSLGLALDPALDPNRYRALQDQAAKSMVQQSNQTQAAPDVAAQFQQQR
jgi:hypothetical protein